MKIIANYFDYPKTKKYEILAKVFKKSIEKNCPNLELVLTKLEAPKLKPEKSLTSNTVKLNDWVEKINNSNEDVVFMDCDMLVLQDLKPAFNLEKLFDFQGDVSDRESIYNIFLKNKIRLTKDFKITQEKENYIISDKINNTNKKFSIQKSEVFDFWDIGYMKRSNCRLPYNGGVVFVRNTADAHNFIKLWQDINSQMYKNRKMHCIYRGKYGGMNQAAFGYILEKLNFQAVLKSFPCRIWDACREDWSYVNIHETKVIHIKSELRRAVLGNLNGNKLCRNAFLIWREYAKGIT